MDKWEYKTVKVLAKGLMGGVVDNNEFTERLNRLGEQGWELVSCFTTNQSYGSSREVTAVMKRRC